MLTTRTLNNLIMQRIEILTKPDEFYFFWHTSFDRVRRSHRPDTSSMPRPPHSRLQPSVFASLGLTRPRAAPQSGIHFLN